MNEHVVTAIRAPDLDDAEVLWRLSTVYERILAAEHRREAHDAAQSEVGGDGTTDGSPASQNRNH